MKNIVNINDEKFGFKLVEKLNEYYSEPNGKKRQYFLIECLKCNLQFKIKGLYFYRDYNHCQDCLFKTSNLVKIGNTYDNLTVIDFKINKNNRKEALCKCVCGNIVSRRPELLSKINMTNNCGCLKRGSYKGVGDLSQTKFKCLKVNAKTRNLDFKVTKEYLWNLFLNQDKKCIYSKLDIHFGKKIKRFIYSLIR